MVSQESQRHGRVAVAVFARVPALVIDASEMTAFFVSVESGVLVILVFVFPLYRIPSVLVVYTRPYCRCTSWTNRNDPLGKYAVCTRPFSAYSKLQKTSGRLVYNRLFPFPQ